MSEQPEQLISLVLVEELCGGQQPAGSLIVVTQCLPDTVAASKAITMSEVSMLKNLFHLCLTTFEELFSILRM